MPVLPNPRHEKFCQEMAAGRSVAESYRNAGYKENRRNAARLKSSEHIRERTREIQAAGAASAKVSVETLLAELEHARQRADSLNQLSASVKAISEKAKVSGLLTQKVELEVSQAEAADFPPPFWVESDYPRFVMWTLEIARERYPDNALMVSWSDAMADVMMQFYPHQTPAWRSPGSQRRRQRQVIDGVAQRVIGNGKDES